MVGAGETLGTTYPVLSTEYFEFSASSSALGPARNVFLCENETLLLCLVLRTSKLSIPEVPMQSPAMIVGLHRIATSLWLHFVALPQRVPAVRYRRGGRPVINVIDRVPPLITSNNVRIPPGTEVELTIR
jgi:hypothetical protein